ncbi:hypothetical protein BLNAU_16668 [Blattamonas nauphoetae]|uniref:Uncharacterized protein n=1 Tax=Blattamonas nauphoetae TaxID=2049346 RepID=A0ABQ9X845_9EUKA|nr:hypothetical protein BLNAU_16668 [Blattamonas nauphoetae]
MPSVALLFLFTCWSGLLSSATTSHASSVVTLNDVLFGSANLDDTSSRFRLDPVSYECSSFLLDSVRLELEGASPTTIRHSRVLRAQLSESLSDGVPDRNLEPKDLFTIRNSTVSFNTLIFDLETTFLEMTRSAQFSNQIQSSSLRAAIVDSSCVSFSNSAFRVGRVVSPIVVSATHHSNPTDTSVTFFTCELQSPFALIPSFVEISDPMTITRSTSVTIASSSVSSQSITSHTGLAMTLLHPFPLPSLTTSISSSSFVNVTAASNQTPSKHRLCLTQQLIGVDMNRVENGLYGTVSAFLSSSLHFSCCNSTLIECENMIYRNDQSDPSIKNITESPTLTNATGAFRSYPLFTHYHFTDNNITSHTQQASFNIISIPDLAGTVKLTRCTININCTSQHVGVMDLAGEVDANHRLVIDSSTVTYDKANNLANTSNQIITRYSVMTDVSNSFFTSLDGASRTRTFNAMSSQALMQFSNSRVTHQSVEGSGAVLSYADSNHVLYLPLDKSRVSSLELLAENEQQELEALNLALSTISETTLSHNSVIPRLVSLVAGCTLVVEGPSQIVSSIVHPLLHSLTADTHFSTINGNKIMIVKSDGLPTLVRLLSRSPILSLPPLIPQNALTTLWNCARNEEIKDISRSVGASISSEVDLQTIETALGSLLSLTVNGENKSYVREHNGLPLLVSCLARVQITPHTPQHIPVLHTALTTLRNCCSNGVLLAALSNPFLLSHKRGALRPGRREAVLLVKNLTLVDQNKKEIVLQQPHKPILELSLTSQKANVGRVANDIIRSISSHRCRISTAPLDKKCDHMCESLLTPSLRVSVVTLLKARECSLLSPLSWNYWASSSVMQIGGVVGCSGGMTSRFSFGKLSPEASRFGDRCWDGGDCGGERGWKKDKKVYEKSVLSFIPPHHHRETK